MAKTTYQVRPGRGVGQFYLGATLQEILARLKKAQLDKGAVNIAYSATDPVNAPILVTLHTDGIRLRFDGAEQRLRLVEIIDFTRSVFLYNGNEIYKPDQAMSVSSPTGPHYRMVTKLFGPTFPPEYLPPKADDPGSKGTCILSYPGVAISFPIDHKAWKPNVDSSALSSSAAKPATSLAIFHGRTWEEARVSLFSQSQPSDTTSQPRSRSTSTPAPLHRNANSISLVKIYGQGRIHVVRPSSTEPISITLGETTPQDLISDLGPPDAIYHQRDRRLSIHQRAPNAGRKDEADGRSDEAEPDRSYGHFYNYFRHGFDILISTPNATSQASPSMPEALQAQFVSGGRGPEDPAALDAGVGSDRLVATKLLLHANIPSSFDFGRYTRCRWSLEHVPSAASTAPVTSEMKFDAIAARMKEVWGGASPPRFWEVNRGWMSADVDIGSELGESVEVVEHGAWEEGSGSGSAVYEEHGGGIEAEERTQLYGFPGLVFEVLKSGVVGCLTVY